MPESTVMPEPQPIDIDDTAVADGCFTTFVVAVQTAGLVDALKGEGPLTVKNNRIRSVEAPRVGASLHNHSQISCRDQTSNRLLGNPFH